MIRLGGIEGSSNPDFKQYHKLRLGDKILGANGVPGLVVQIKESDDYDEHFITISWDNGRTSYIPEYWLDRCYLLEYF